MMPMRYRRFGLAGAKRHRYSSPSDDKVITNSNQQDIARQHPKASRTLPSGQSSHYLELHRSIESDYICSKLARRGGVSRISKAIYEEIRATVMIRLRESI